MKNLLKQKNKISISELISYPYNSLGFHLGRYLFKKGYEYSTLLEKEDVYRLLLTKDTSAKEEFGMYFYLFGNGNFKLDTLSEMFIGFFAYPLAIKYYYKRYQQGKNALRFHDLDHFKMLHLPLERIKDTFLIK